MKRIGEKVLWLMIGIIVGLLVAWFMWVTTPKEACAGEWFTPLDRKDWTLMATDTALLVVDWGQTRYIADHPDRYWEAVMQPVLGRHPSVGRVNTNFITVIPIYWLSAWALPPKEDYGYKRWVNRMNLNILVGGCETGATLWNAHIGIKMMF